MRERMVGHIHRMVDRVVGGMESIGLRADAASFDWIEFSDTVHVKWIISDDDGYYGEEMVFSGDECFRYDRLEGIDSHESYGTHGWFRRGVLRRLKGLLDTEFKRIQILMAMSDDGD